MSKIGIFYYSKSGSNSFLAKKLGENLGCDTIEVKPRLKSLFSIMMASLTGLSFGNKAIDIDIASFDKVIVCGPIWAGKIVSPITDLIKKYNKSLKKVYLATSCAGGDDTKDDKFGYNSGINQVKNLVSDKFIFGAAFPTTMVLSEDEKKDSNIVMKTVFNESNFNKELTERLNQFVDKVKNS